MKAALVSAAIYIAIVGRLFAASEPCRHFSIVNNVFDVTGTALSSDTTVSCYDEYSNLFLGFFESRSWVVDETTSSIVGQVVCPDCSKGRIRWTAIVNGSTIAGHCYRSRTQASSSFDSQAIGTARKCATVTASNECSIRPWLCDPYYFDECPLLIQLGTGPWNLTSVDDGVLFDLNADGVRDRTAWTQARSTLAFLVLDLNGNGLVDDARELFGEHMALPDDSDVMHGFAALSFFDDDRNGVIDEMDDVWQSLLVWSDVNHDGTSQPPELQLLKATEVAAISTDYSASQRRDNSAIRFGISHSCGIAPATFDLITTSSSRHALSRFTRSAAEPGGGGGAGGCARCRSRNRSRAGRRGEDARD